MSAEKTYLGDGVYVAIDRGMVRLTAEDGIAVQHTIYLEGEVLANLLDWLQHRGVITWQRPSVAGATPAPRGSASGDSRPRRSWSGGDRRSAVYRVHTSDV